MKCRHRIVAVRVGAGDLYRDVKVDARTLLNAGGGACCRLARAAPRRVVLQLTEPKAPPAVRFEPADVSRGIALAARGRKRALGAPRWPSLDAGALVQLV